MGFAVEILNSSCNITQALAMSGNFLVGGASPPEAVGSYLHT